MPWWHKNNIRMIQNNIRDVDVSMDIDRHIEWLKSFDVNVLQIGCGGITAFHPSKLDCQVVNPYMKGDFFGEVLKKCHENGIRVIARFDFSKTHESLFEKYPEWYSRDMRNEPVRYHDTVATCVNGEYQREKSLEIIREVITKYPVDGIFFNMFGYITNDYSGNYVGICQCENCKKRFKEMYGEELPVKEDLNDPVFIKYLEFKKRTTDGILYRIHELVQSVSPEIAVSTYGTTHGVDIVRNESNSALDRPLPFWIYSSEDNVSQIEDGHENTVSSNCAINAVDLPYRFMGVSKYLNQLRMYGDIASGSGLDWCIIGNFDDYPDYENFDSTREVFRHHKRYEEYYGHFKQNAKIMLVKYGERRELNAEYRGVYKLLKEEHLMFSVVDLEAIEDKISMFDEYEFILLPGVETLPDRVIKALESTKASVIASGMSLEKNGEAVEGLFSLRLREKVEDVRGTYIKTVPKQIFDDFQEKQWVFLDKDYWIPELLCGAEGILPKVEKSMFGPPERCFGHEDTETPMAVVSGSKNVYFTWHTAGLYYQYGYDVFKRLYLDVMKSLRPIPRTFETNAPEMVEVLFNECSAGVYMLQFINLTGFNGMNFFRPLGVKDVTVNLAGITPAAVLQMTEEGLVDITEEALASDVITVSLECGKIYQSYLIRT